MRERGKKYRSAAEKVDARRRYPLAEAVAVLKQTARTKFDETVDLAIRLGVDPKQSDQMVRGAVALPWGLGKTLKVVVFARGEKEKEAQAAGADTVGADDLAKRIQEGWLDFDVVIATPDMMGLVGRLGKILGPRGLMPNPKVGTVTFDLAKAVSEAKKGRVDFKIDKAGIVHASVGKVSFPPDHLQENMTALLEAVAKLKPPTSKGIYMKSVTASATMGPGVRIDTSELNLAV